MKKILAITLLIFMLCACGNKSVKETPVTTEIKAVAIEEKEHDALPVKKVETETKEKKMPVCAVSINCKKITENIDKLDEEKRFLVPPDGIILAETIIEFTEGETAFDVLKRVTRENNIHLEFSETPMYNSSYIEGINNLYEFDCGSLSGWMYRVNGIKPNVGCSQYTVKNGDKIEFYYTCNFMEDNE